jgi:hypothetical protein
MCIKIWGQCCAHRPTQVFAEQAATSGTYADKSACYKELILALNPRTIPTTVYNRYIPADCLMAGCRSVKGVLHDFSRAVVDRVWNGWGSARASS